MHIQYYLYIVPCLCAVYISLQAKDLFVCLIQKITNLRYQYILYFVVKYLP